MTAFSYRHTENIFETKDNLGFYCFNEFTILNANLCDLADTEILLRVFKSKFFADKFIAPQGIIRRTPLNEHGPLLIDELSAEDYFITDFEGLKEKIGVYQMDETWGADLDPFKMLFKKSLEVIEEKRLSKSLIFYLNQEELEGFKKLEVNYYTYFISLIIVSNDSNRIALVDYGGD